MVRELQEGRTKEIFKWVSIWVVLAASIGTALTVPGMSVWTGDKPESAQALPAQTKAPEDASPSPVSMAASVQPSPSPAPARFAIANTDGLGVYIRRSRADADKIRAWRDGTEMVEVGPPQETNGVTWRNVKDPAGNTGWIQDRYLATPTLPPKPAASATPAPSPTASPAASAVSGGTLNQLELLSSSMTGGYGFVLVEGLVKNISGKSLQNVIAVVSWQNVSHKPVQKGEDFILLNPLAPGQVSPFKIVTSSSPEMKLYVVSFKELSGEEILTLDSRKR